MNKIHQLENALSTNWESHYKNLGLKESFCFDGLCYNGSVYNDDHNCEIGNEEQLWTNAKRKILFLMKDTNDNPNCDYRDWSWHLITNPFFKLIFAWLHGLTNITQENYPPLEDGYCQ